MHMVRHTIYTYLATAVLVVLCLSSSATPALGAASQHSQSPQLFADRKAGNSHSSPKNAPLTIHGRIIDIIPLSQPRRLLIMLKVGSQIVNAFVTPQTAIFSGNTVHLRLGDLHIGDEIVLVPAVRGKGSSSGRHGSSALTAVLVIDKRAGSSTLPGGTPEGTPPPTVTGDISPTIESTAIPTTTVGNGEGNVPPTPGPTQSASDDGNGVVTSTVIATPGSEISTTLPVTLTATVTGTITVPTPGTSIVTTTVPPTTTIPSTTTEGTVPPLYTTVLLGVGPTNTAEGTTPIRVGIGHGYGRPLYLLIGPNTVLIDGTGAPIAVTALHVGDILGVDAVGGGKALSNAVRSGRIIAAAYVQDQGASQNQDQQGQNQQGSGQGQDQQGQDQQDQQGQGQQGSGQDQQGQGQSGQDQQGQQGQNQPGQGQPGQP